MEAREGPFSILVVCTGNVCRSPLAAQLLKARLTSADIPISVASAGTRALAGQPMTPEAAALSVQYGGDPAQHRARQLSLRMVEEADLILTAARDHRAEAVSLYPRASRQTFTLRQFARIVASPDASALIDPVAGWGDAASQQYALRSFVSAVAAGRGIAPPPAHASDDDIEDPYLQPKRVYLRAGHAIDEAVTTIVAGFASAVRQR